MPRRRLKYSIVLGSIAAFILVAGSLLKPSQRPAVPAGPSQEDIAGLQRLTQQKGFDRQAAEFNAIAEDSARHLIYLPVARRSSVLLPQDVFLTASEPPFRQQAQLMPSHPVVRVAPRELPKGKTPADPVSRIVPGSWAVGVALDESGARIVSPTHFVGIGSRECMGRRLPEALVSSRLLAAMNGGGLFAVDGTLIGVIVQCERDIFVLPTQEALQLSGATPAQGGGGWQMLGLRVTPLNELAQSYFRVKEGLLVIEIRAGGTADRAGLEVGDVLLAKDGETIQPPADLRTLSDAGWKLQVLRDRTRRTSLTVKNEASDDVHAGVLFEDPNQGVRVARLEIGSALWDAGLRDGDIVTEVNDQSLRSDESLERLMRAEGTKFVVVRRGARSLGFLLP